MATSQGQSETITRAFYEAMSRDELIARLKVAEDALTLIGWSSIPVGQHPESERCQAAEQMWSIWSHYVGRTFTDVERHPDLDAMEPQLAASRRAIRAETMAKIDRLLKPEED